MLYQLNYIQNQQIAITIYTTTHTIQKHRKKIYLGQALSAKRICKETEDLVTSLETLKTGFVSRGYKEEFINTEFKKRDNYRRNKLLTYKSKEINMFRGLQQKSSKY